jgi:hypothetical protein
MLNEQDATTLLQAYDGLPADQQAAAKAKLQAYHNNAKFEGYDPYPTSTANKAKAEAQYESLFDDLKNVDALNPTLAAVAPMMIDADAERAKEVNRQFLSRRYGKPVDELRDDVTYQLHRDAYAQEQWADYGAQDDKGFYQSAKIQTAREKDERVMHQEAAHEGAFSAMDGDAGKSGLAGLAAWQGQAQGKSGYLASQAKTWLESYNRTNDLVAPHRPLIANTIAAMSKTMEGLTDDPEAEKTLAATREALIDMPGEQRRAVIAALVTAGAKRGEASGKADIPQFLRELGKTMSAQQWGGESGDATGAAGSLVVQAGEALGRMAGQATSGRQSKMQALAAVPENGLATTTLGVIDTPEKARQFVSESTGNYAMQHFHDSVDGPSNFTPKGTERQLTPDESRLIIEAKARSKRAINISREIQDIAESTDPIKSVVASTAGTSIGIMAPLALGGPMMAVPMAAVYQEIEYEDLSRKYPDMAEGQKSMIASISAPIQAALDLVELGALKRLPSLSDFITKGITKAMLGGAAVQGLKSYGLENAVELVQDFSTPIIQDLAHALSSDMPSVDWEMEKRNFWQGRADVALGMIPLTLIGLGYSSAQGYQRGKSALEVNQNLGEMGFPHADRVTIADAFASGDNALAQQAIQEAFPRRSPEIAAEFGNEARASRLAMQQAIAQAQDRGMLPRWRRDGEGFSVRVGNDSIRVDSMEQVQEISMGHLNEWEKQQQAAVANVAGELLDRGTTAEAWESAPSEDRKLRDEAAQDGNLDSVLQAARVAAQLEGVAHDDATALERSVVGSNRAEMVEAVRTLVSRGFQQASVLTPVEEFLEGRVKLGLSNGTFTAPQLTGWVRSTEAATGLSFLGDEASFTARSEGEQQRLVLESISKIVVADVLGQDSSGKHFAAGTISRGIKAQARGYSQRINDAKADLNAKEAGKFRHFLRLFRTMIGAALKTAKAIALARKDGKLGEDHDAFVDKLLGANAEQRFASEVERQTKAMLGEEVGEDGSYSLGAITNSRAKPADTSNITEMPDGAQLVGPTTFSLADYGGNHRPNSEGPRAFDLAEADVSPADVYEHPEWYSSMDAKIIRETMAQLRKVKGKPDGEVSIYRAGPKGEMNEGDWVSLSKEYARTHADRQDPEGFRVWVSKVRAQDLRWAMDDLAEFGYFGKSIPAQDTGVSFSISAYHGTPHKVDKFSLAKIGTGEGAQAYGWGLYFAGNKAVAEGYQRKLSVANEYARMAMQLKGSRSEAVEYMRSDSWDQRNKDVQSAIAELLSNNSNGNLYTVELLPDEADFLDWDKPLSEQSAKVKAAMEKTNETPFDTSEPEYGSISSRLQQAIKEARHYNQDPKWDLVHQELAINGRAKLASQALATLGIPGIRYLDGNSRDGGKGTSNYVIFDESLVKILEENGKAVEEGEPSYSLGGAKTKNPDSLSTDGAEFPPNSIAGSTVLPAFEGSFQSAPISRQATNHPDGGYGAAQQERALARLRIAQSGIAEARALLAQAERLAANAARDAIEYSRRTGEWEPGSDLVIYHEGHNEQTHYGFRQKTGGSWDVVLPSNAGADLRRALTSLAATLPKTLSAASIEETDARLRQHYPETRQTAGMAIIGVNLRGVQFYRDNVRFEDGSIWNPRNRQPVPAEDGARDAVVARREALIEAEAELYLAEDEEGGTAGRMDAKRTAGARVLETQRATFAAMLDARDEDAKNAASNFIAKVWNAIAGHDEAFQFGRTDSPDASEIARAVSTPGHSITMEEHADSVRVMGSSGYLTINDTDTSRPWIRSTEAGSKGKKSGGGTQLYQAALDWIHNNGKTIKDDPGGLTAINAIRRTSAFLASALRWGTTKHLQPHAAQGVKWKAGSHTRNLAALAAKEMYHAFKAVVEAQGWRYDFNNGAFTDSNGESISDGQFSSAVIAGNPAASGVGLSTLQRAIITRSSIEAFQRGEAVGVLSEVDPSRELPERLTHISYSLSPADRLGLAAQTMAQTLDARHDGTRKFLEKAHDGMKALRQRWADMPARIAKGDLDKYQARMVEVRLDELEAASLNGEESVLDVERDGGNILAMPEMAKFTEHPLAIALRTSRSARKRYYAWRLKPEAAWRRIQIEKFGKIGGEYDQSTGPRLFFQGEETPDQLASEIHANQPGLVKGPYADDLWEAISAMFAEVSGNRELLAKAQERLKAAKARVKAEAEFEGNAWRYEQDQIQARLGSPRQAAVRDVAMLEVFANALPPEVRGKLRLGLAGIAEISSDKAFVKELTQRAKAIDKALNEHWAAVNAESLAELIALGIGKKEPGKKRRGTATPEVHRYFAMVEAVVNADPKELALLRAGLVSKLEGEKQEDQQEEGEQQEEEIDELEMIQRLNTVDLWGGFSKKHVADQSALLNEGWATYRRGRNLWFTAEEKRLEATRRDAQAFIEANGIGTYGAQSRTRAKRGVVAALTADFTDIGGYMRRLVGDLPLIKTWEDGLTKAFAAKEFSLAKLRKRWEAALAEAMPDMSKSQRERRFFELHSKRSITVDITEEKLNALINAKARDQLLLEGWTPEQITDSANLTEAEAMTITLTWGQSKYRASLTRSGFTADVVAQLEQRLSPEAKSLRAWMSNQLKEQHAPLNEVFRRVGGINLPQIPNYWPGRFYSAGNERDSLDVMGAGVVGSGFADGWMKERKGHAALVKIDSAFSTFWGHMNQSEHWRHLAEPVREMRGVFRNPQVKKALMSNSGDQALVDVTAWLDILEANGSRALNGATEKTLNRLLANFSLGRLAWNPFSLARQSTAVFNVGYADGLTPGMLFKGAGSILSNPANFIDIYQELYASDEIFARVEGGMSPEVRNALNEFWKTGPGLWKSALDKGMENLGFVDAFFTTIGGVVAYEAHAIELENAGHAPAKAHEMAIAAAKLAILNTAQPTTVNKKSLIENRTTDAIRKSVMMFLSDGRQKWAFYQESVFDVVKNGRKASKNSWNRLLWTWLVVGPAANIVAAGLRDLIDGGDDDEIFDGKNWTLSDFAMSSFLGPLRGFFLAGSVVESLMDRWAGRKAFTPSGGSIADMPEEVVTDALRLGGYLLDDKDQTPEQYGKAALNLMSETGGVPAMVAATIKRAMKLADQ